MLPHFINQCLLLICLLLVKWSFTGGEKQLKRGHHRLREVVANLETLGILENWCLRRGVGLQEVPASRGSTVMFFLITRIFVWPLKSFILFSARTFAQVNYNVNG